MVDKDAHNGIGGLRGVFRLDDNSGFPREVLVSRDAAKPELEAHARRRAVAIVHLNRSEGDVAGVLQDGDDAALVAARAAWGHLFDTTRPSRGTRCGREDDGVAGA